MNAVSKLGRWSVITALLGGLILLVALVITGLWLLRAANTTLTQSPLLTQVVSPSSSQPSSLTGRAQWTRYDSLGALTQKADLIIFATVAATEPTTPIGSLPYTLVHLNVNRILKGHADSRITLLQSGGVAGNTTVYLEGNPPYRGGKRYLLFLVRGSSIPGMDANLPEHLDKYVIVNPQGRFIIEDGQMVPQINEDKVAREVASMKENQVINTIERLK